MDFSILEKNKKIIFIVLAVCFAALVFSHLLADANPAIDFSSGIYADEIWRAYPEKEVLLHGETTPRIEFCSNCSQPDWAEPNNFVVKPLFLVPIFFLGVNFFALHITALIVTLLAFIIFLAFVLDRNFDFRATLAFGLLFVFNFLNLEFGKIALLETFMAVFLAASFALLLAFLDRRKGAFLYASIILFFLALMVKTTALFFIIVFIAAFILKREKFTRQNILIGCIIMLAALSYGLFLNPTLAQMNSTSIMEHFSKNMREFARSIWMLPRNRFFVFNVFAIILAVFSIAMFVKSTKLRLKSLSKENTAIALLIAWIIALIAETAFSTYQPTRYLMLLALPVMALAGIAFHKRSSRILELLMFLAIAFSLINFFVLPPNYGIINANNELKNFPEKVLCGGFGYTVFFESKDVQCYAGGNAPTSPDVIKELGINYIVAQEGTTKDYEKSFVLEKVSGFELRANPVGVENIVSCLYGNSCGNYKIGLYKIVAEKNN